jgi:hypothetical protein
MSWSTDQNARFAISMRNGAAAAKDGQTVDKQLSCKDEYSAC